MLPSVAAIVLGASIGALLRWRLGLWLAPSAAGFPWGTLAANLLGGYLIGLAVAFFAQHPQLSPAWRLLVITGFLGGLTTFSTFSAEVVDSLLQGRWPLALALAATHVLGSLALTALGLASFKLWARTL